MNLIHQTQHKVIAMGTSIQSRRHGNAASTWFTRLWDDHIKDYVGRMLIKNYSADGWISRGGQPNLLALRWLKNNDHVGLVVNLRSHSKEESTEAAQVIALGMDYYNLPIQNINRISDADLEPVFKLIDQSIDKGQRVFIHDRNGELRASKVMAMYNASRADVQREPQADTFSAVSSPSNASWFPWAQQLRNAVERFSIKNFSHVDETVSRGGQPPLFMFKWLRDVENIGLVINLRNKSSKSAKEHEEVRRLGMKYIRISLDEYGISDKQLDLLFALIEAAKSQGKRVYIHCRHGQDRTGLIIAMYKLKYHPEATLEQVKNEMIQSGHNEEDFLFYIRQLEQYARKIGKTSQ